MPNSTAQPQLLSQMNERSVLRLLQSTGPCSRADVTRQLGATAPTVSKAVASLLRSGLLEEFDAPSNGRGRPARYGRACAADLTPHLSSSSWLPCSLRGLL